MLNQLVGKIVDLWNAPDQWIEAELQHVLPDATEAEPDPGDLFRTQFLNLARQRQRQNGRVVSSLLTIVWQGNKLAALGAHYREIKALMAMVTEVVLEQMADRPDFFLRYDSDNVLLCFASANKAVTEVRTAMMAQALRAALLQRMPDLAGKIRIDFVVTAVEPVEAVAKGPNLVAGLIELLGRARDSSAIAMAAPAL
jgi:hypothetical protein